jgi:7-carboxy-7-deazaguanine synthase
MTYAVKEAFLTLQGEGAHAGRAAVFCRFARCNLWTGHEQHRASAICQFCDTDFVGTDGEGGGLFTRAEALAAHLAHLWDADPARSARRPFVVCTGGEPLLQLDTPLVDALHARGFEIAIETNGTLEPPPGIDWICMSPKAGAEVVLTHGDELKLVFPQEGGAPERYADLDFAQFFLQPMDGPDRAAHTRAAIAYCLAHPQWRLSIQTHKILGIR